MTLPPRPLYGPPKTKRRGRSPNTPSYGPTPPSASYQGPSSYGPPATGRSYRAKPPVTLDNLPKPNSPFQKAASSARALSRPQQFKRAASLASRLDAKVPPKNPEAMRFRLRGTRYAFGRQSLVKSLGKKRTKSLSGEDNRAKRLAALKRILGEGRYNQLFPPRGRRTK